MTRKNTWTEDDDEMLRLFWLSETHAEIAARLPGRSENAVRSRCWKLGLVAKMDWSEFDVRALRQWYSDHDGKKLDLAGLASLLGRSRYSLSIKARHLGLSKKSRPRGGTTDRRIFKGDTAAARRSIGKKMRDRIAANGHPRGMLGKKKTAESIARTVAGGKNWRALQSSSTISEIAQRSVSTRIRRYGTAGPVNISNPYSRAKRGRRDDLGDVFFRSRWEANYARFLNLLKSQGQIVRWEFEPDTFWFEAIKRGVRSYTPDFKIWDRGGAIYYIEVKGWMDAKSKTKLKRMKKYHPVVDLRLFGEKAYRELERKLGTAIPGWEVG